MPGAADLRQLVITAGALEEPGAGVALVDERVRRQAERRQVSRARDMAQALQAVAGGRVRFELLPGEDHGGVLMPSARLALEMAEPDRAAFVRALQDSEMMVRFAAARRLALLSDPPQDALAVLREVATRVDGDGIAAYGLLRMASSGVEAWGDGKELLIGAGVTGVIFASFLLGLWLTRLREAAVPVRAGR